MIPSFCSMIPYVLIQLTEQLVYSMENFSWLRHQERKVMKVNESRKDLEEVGAKRLHLNFD